jgi:hypothetical protein
MNENKKNLIEVTSKLSRCLEYAIEAMNNFPDGEQKQITMAALDYIDKAFKGEPEPELEWPCKPGILLVP